MSGRRSADRIEDLGGNLTEPGDALGICHRVDVSECDVVEPAVDDHPSVRLRQRVLVEAEATDHIDILRVGVHVLVPEVEVVDRAQGLQVDAFAVVKVEAASMEFAEPSAAPVAPSSFMIHGSKPGCGSA